jgi:hypothetical protein
VAALKIRNDLFTDPASQPIPDPDPAPHPSRKLSQAKKKLPSTGFINVFEHFNTASVPV